MKKVGLILIGILFILGVVSVSADESGAEMLFSWHAYSYTPSGFDGRALPITGTLIEAGFDLVQGGKLVNLKDQIIYWYWNDSPIGGGKGVQKISFRPTQEGVQKLTVKLPGYNNGGIVRNFKIPVVTPEAVIEAPFQKGNFSSLNLKVQGRPYFFNVLKSDALQFLWDVNGQKPSNTENSDVLNINLDQSVSSGSQFQINLSISNPRTFLETDSETKVFNFIK